MIEPISNEKLVAFLQINLPSDIKRSIYEEHFKMSIIYNKKYDELMKQVNSEECKSLDRTKLVSMVETVIEKPNFCKFVCSKNELFARLYDDHYRKGKKNFVRMNDLNSLTMSWLMYLYH
jgi:hypothetical protein